MYIGKLFNKYDVNVPIKDRLNIIIGDNGSGKTKVLELLKDYYIENGENVLYFSSDRFIEFGKEDMDAYDVSEKLLGKNSLRERIELAYDISDPFSYEEIEYGKHIDCGYLQLINFFYKIAIDPRDNLIVIIDYIERSLHLLIKRQIINDLLKFLKIKNMIISIYSPSIVENGHQDKFISIEDCVKLYE